MPSILSNLSYQYKLRTNAKDDLKTQLSRSNHGDPRYMTPPEAFRKKYTVEADSCLERPVYYLDFSRAADAPCVLYVHGGAFLTGLIKKHWKLCDSILRGTVCPVVVPDYPLIPEHTCRQTLQFCMTLYEALTSRCPHGVILMGDSAGANLALAVAQNAKKAGLPAPKKLLFLSPFLDATGNNPVKNVLSRRDPVLEPDGGREAALLYAGSLPLSDPRVSPLFGPMKDLPPVSIWTGDNDMLYADALQLRQKLHNAHVPYHLYTYPGMVHDWMLESLPEARKAVKQILTEIWLACEI